MKRNIKEEEPLMKDELEMEIKSLFEKKILTREMNNFYLDYDELILKVPEVEEELSRNPKTVILMINKEIKDRFGNNLHLRFKNLSYSEEISDIRVKHLGKIVKVKGIITNITEIHPLTLGTTWECLCCNTKIHKEGNNPPLKCSCGDKAKKFNLISKDQVDLQELYIEEDYANIGKRAPKKVRVRLMDDLCDRTFNNVIIPGNRVEIIGIAEDVPLISQINKTKEEISQFRIHALQVNNLENEFDGLISEEDIEEIKEIAYDHPLERLSSSLAPNVKGRDLEKKGLILAMVRGKPSKKSDGREDKDTIHILLVGDPGQAKSDMMMACSKLHWKGLFADCIDTTAAALTATAEQDKLTGSWSLMPGLLVLGNQGLVILDEFDKAKDGAKQALHTVMESKIVSVNKGGINTTLPADSTLIIGANPKNSMFDPSKPLVPQINLPPTILSRMDLIFIFQDNVDKDKDGLIADSILGLDDSEKDYKPIDIILFKKYLKYIQAIQPKMSRNAAELLKEKYIQVRQMAKRSDGLNGMPIGPRHLNALKRLSEANAKIRLSEEVEEEDVNIAYGLFEKSLMKLGMDNDGIIDITRIGEGTSLNTQNKREKLYLFIRDRTAEKGFATTEEINDLTIKLNIDTFEGDRLIRSLKDEGVVLSPKFGSYKAL